MLLPRPGVASYCQEPGADGTITVDRVLLLFHDIQWYSHITSSFSPMPCHPAARKTRPVDSTHAIPFSAGLDSCDDPPALLQELGDELNRTVAGAQEDRSGRFRLQDALD